MLQRNTDIVRQQGLHNERLLVLGTQHLTTRLGQYPFADIWDIVRQPRSIVLVTGNSIVAKETGAGYNISRILYAERQWETVLGFAINPQIRHIVFNSSRLSENILNDRIRSKVPHSYPGKLLAILYKRYHYFAYVADKGFSIFTIGGGDVGPERLESVLLELAHRNGLETSFLDWLENANQFRPGF